MRYGEAVQVEYVDLADPKNQAQFSELLAVAEDRDLPYPLVAVNGQVKSAGSAHYYRVLPLVQAALGEKSAVRAT
jgi:disulfide oxidoreductase YuzD